MTAAALYALCDGGPEGDCTGRRYRETFTPPEPELGQAFESWEVGLTSEIPHVCPGCGGELTLHVSWPLNDAVAWLVGQPQNVQAAYLQLREGGMGDAQAREMSVVTHLPAPD